MAKKITDIDKPNGKANGNKGHNVAEIKATIKSAAQTISKLKADRAEINAEITKERAKVRAAGILATDFNVALRLYELEAEDRNDSIDGLKLSFEALEIGGQGDLFPSTADGLKVPSNAPAS